MLSINLKEKVAIVTGGANGIGRATSLQLAKTGASVIVSDINFKGAEKVVQEILEMGGTGRAIKTDVTNKNDVTYMVNQTFSEFGQIDILVNNAGISKAIRFMDVDLDQFNDFFDVNVKGVYLCCQAVLVHMIKQNSGKIVNISSVAGKEADEFFVVYSATKSAVLGLTQGLAKEMSRYNINVNAVCPGIIQTKLWENLLKQLKGSPEYQDLREEEIWDQFVETIPLKRPQEPEDIANMVVFLCSDFSKNITGQGINVCGGLRFH